MNIELSVPRHFLQPRSSCYAILVLQCTQCWKQEPLLVVYSFHTLLVYKWLFILLILPLNTIVCDCFVRNTIQIKRYGIFKTYGNFLSLTHDFTSEDFVHCSASLEIKWIKLAEVYEKFNVNELFILLSFNQLSVLSTGREAVSMPENRYSNQEKTQCVIWLA